MKTLKQPQTLLSGIILIITMFLSGKTIAQNAMPADTLRDPILKETPPKRKLLKMTTLTFGGTGINFTKVNDQFSVMTGGRGAATFNTRFTIGGGGWGMTRGVKAESDQEGIYNFIKMGYGGIDFGYLFFPGERFNLGTKLLVAGGAVFKETVPESGDKSFRMFPVLEPTLYYQVSLSKLFRFEMGTSYRFIRGTNLPYITDSQMSGFSCYVGFLICAIKSN